MNPFGVLITDETLKAMSRYHGKSITQEDREREATRLIHAEGKDLNALAHALNLKSNYGSGASTLCLLYNATCDTIELADKKDWFGQIYKVELPWSFQNGQWLTFHHTHDAGLTGSTAARVYGGKNINGDVRDFLVAWSTPSDATPNLAYTDIREKDYFSQHWDDLRGSLRRAGKMTKDENDEHCTSTVSIDGYTTLEYIAVLQHKFRPLP